VPDPLPLRLRKQVGASRTAGSSRWHRSRARGFEEALSRDRGRHRARSRGRGSVHRRGGLIRASATERSPHHRRRAARHLAQAPLSGRGRGWPDRTGAKLAWVPRRARRPRARSRPAACRPCSPWRAVPGSPDARGPRAEDGPSEWDLAAGRALPSAARFANHPTAIIAAAASGKLRRFWLGRRWSTRATWPTPVGPTDAAGQRGFPWSALRVRVLTGDAAGGCRAPGSRRWPRRPGTFRGLGGVAPRTFGDGFSPRPAMVPTRGVPRRALPASFDVDLGCADVVKIRREIGSTPGDRGGREPAAPSVREAPRPGRRRQPPRGTSPPGITLIDLGSLTDGDEELLGTAPARRSLRIGKALATQIDVVDGEAGDCGHRPRQA